MSDTWVQPRFHRSTSFPIPDRINCHSDCRHYSDAQGQGSTSRMASSVTRASWNRRPRAGELRFFADLEEKNNRNDSQPSVTYQRRSKHHLSQQGHHSSTKYTSSPYDRSFDRFSHKHHHHQHQRDLSSGRSRFPSDSNGNKYTGSSSCRSLIESSIDPLRRSTSDQTFARSSSSSEAQFPLTSSSSSTTRSVKHTDGRSLTGNWGSSGSGVERKDSLSPNNDAWHEDENRTRDSVLRQTQCTDSNSSSGGCSDLTHRIKRMKYSRTTRGPDHHRHRHKDQDGGDVSSSDHRLIRSSSSCSRRHGESSDSLTSPVPSRTGVKAEDSPTSGLSFCSPFLCPVVEESAESQTEGNIDLVHLTKDHPVSESPLIARRHSIPAVVNDDAASISTITSGELSHAEDAVLLTPSELSDEDRYSEDSAGGTVCSRRRRRSRSMSVRSRRSSCSSGWNSRSRIFSQKRSESNPDAVFYEPTGNSPRKFTTRGYQAFCDRVKAHQETQQIRGDGSRFRSSPTNNNSSNSQRKSWHISPRLYDFDDYSTPDRDERINRTLYLGGLNPQLSEQEIRQLFQPFGEIKSVFVKKVDSSRNTTYGFVKMGNLIQAYRARAALNGHPLAFLKLVIRYGKTYPTSRVWLGNLPLDADSGSLYRELDRFGAVVKMVHFRATGEALAEFESIPGAVEAKNGMRGVVLGSAGGSVGVSRTSSRPSSSASSSTPSPTPPALTLSVVPDLVPTTAAGSVIPGCRGIITDFDDHESNGLLDSASAPPVPRVQNSVRDTSLIPPDSSFARMAAGDQSVDPDCISVTSDSEEDEVHLHHMPDSITRSATDADIQNCPQIQVKVEMTEVVAQTVTMTKVRSARLQMSDARVSKHMSHPAPPVTPPLPEPASTVCQNPVILSSYKGPKSTVPVTYKSKNLEPSHFSFEAEDLLSKSLTRLDPRLLSRSGVYRQKSILDPN